MIIKRRLFSNNYDYVKEMLSYSRNDILGFKRNNYPKFYIDYLEKINPIIVKEILEKDGANYFTFPFAVNLNNVNQDDVEVIKNNKRFLMGFATDPELLGFDLAYFGDDRKFYKKTGIFFTKFEEIPNIKEFILDEILGSEIYGSDYWDGPEMPSGIKKIVDAIRKL